MTTSYRWFLTFARRRCLVFGMVRMAGYLCGFSAIVALFLCGCRQFYIDDADREVADLIQKRQEAALGFTSNADVGQELGDVHAGADMYSMVPSPIDPAVPQEFHRATAVQGETSPESNAAPLEAVPTSPQTDGQSPAPATGNGLEQAEESSDTVTTPFSDDRPEPFTLSDALAYATRYSRRFQTEKEILYLSALDLTLERYLWTPRFVQSLLSLEYTNAGQDNDFDQAMSMVSDFAVEQRLPYGGEVTARVINTLMRELGGGVTSGESGQLILETRLPLLRGAGPVAYESRYQAERDLIYVIRRFERFRREFLVDVAGDYFQLLSAKAQIDSAKSQAKSLAEDYKRDKAFLDLEQIIPIDADRTRVAMLNAQNATVIAQERFDTSLDFFKIRMGMPTGRAIDVVDEPLDLVHPNVSAAPATETALKYRLDLLNVRDRIDDARRTVKVARNNLLPQVDLSGSITLDTDPEHRNSLGYNTDRASWRAGVGFEVPLDRKRERNDYRGSLIRLRQAERDLEESVDTVRLEVRRALRRIEQARSTMEIQSENIEINEKRAVMARLKFKLGELPSNRDVVEAEDDLRDARNDYAEALSQFRRAVLEFLRDTGTLRVDADGKWVRYSLFTGGAVSEAEAGGATPPGDAAPAGG